jgi:hypothetical protein
VVLDRHVSLIEGQKRTGGAVGENYLDFTWMMVEIAALP